LIFIPYITLHSLVITTLVYNDRKSFHDAITKFDCVLIGLSIQTERAKRTGFMASTIASSHSRRFLPWLSKSWIITESELAFFLGMAVKNVIYNWKFSF